MFWIIISVICAALAIVATAFPLLAGYMMILLLLTLAGMTSYCLYRIYTGLTGEKKKIFILYVTYGILGILAFMGLIFPKFAALFFFSVTVMAGIYLARSNYLSMLAAVNKYNQQMVPAEQVEPPTVSESIRFTVRKHYCWMVPLILLGLYYLSHLIRTAS